MNLIVKDASLKCKVSGTIRHQTVVRGMQDITPIAAREIVIIGIVNCVVIRSCLDGKFKRWTDHNVLSGICRVSKVVIWEGKEERLVDGTDAGDLDT